jgi:hypothetical protein
VMNTPRTMIPNMQPSVRMLPPAVMKPSISRSLLGKKEGPPA